MTTAAALLRRRGRVTPRTGYKYLTIKKTSKRFRAARLVKLIVLLLPLALAFAAAPRLYETTVTHPYFQIKTVVLNGIETLSREKLMLVIKPLLSGGIFTCDIRSATEYLAGNPWVESVSIRRRLPDALVVDVVERTPAAVVASGSGQFYLIDRQGVVLEETADSGKRLVISGLSENVISPGERIDGRRLDYAFRLSAIFSNDRVYSDPVAFIDVSNLDGITARTAKTGTILYLGADRDEWEEKFIEYLTVRKILSDTSAGFGVINLSFEDQVVVSGVGSNRRGKLFNKKG
ncbi:MAG: hypothetical protein IEMM0002_1079 [bacterium]|nr:MAG: hypothetical protein IEMM0002_1079 [bacterium]